MNPPIPPPASETQPCQFSGCVAAPGANEHLACGTIATGDGFCWTLGCHPYRSMTPATVEPKEKPRCLCRHERDRHEMEQPYECMDCNCREFRFPFTPAPVADLRPCGVCGRHFEADCHTHRKCDRERGHADDCHELVEAPFPVAAEAEKDEAVWLAEEVLANGNLAAFYAVAGSPGSLAHMTAIAYEATRFSTKEECEKWCDGSYVRGFLPPLRAVQHLFVASAAKAEKDDMPPDDPACSCCHQPRHWEGAETWCSFYMPAEAGSSANGTIASAAKTQGQEPQNWYAGLEEWEKAHRQRCDECRDGDGHDALEMAYLFAEYHQGRRSLALDEHIAAIRASLWVIEQRLKKLEGAP